MVTYNPETHKILNYVRSRFGILKKEDEPFEGGSTEKYYTEKSTKSESYYISLTIHEEGLIKGAYVIHRLYDPTDPMNQSVKKITIVDSYVGQEEIEMIFKIAGF